MLPAFVVPSGSMEPTLRPGDRILVERLPAWAGGSALHRGDVVVLDGRRAFLDQPDGTPLQQVGREVASFLGIGAGTDYVKRVVGLPGDRVRCCDSAGRLVVDGTPVDEPYSSPATGPARSPSTSPSPRARVGDGRPPQRLDRLARLPRRAGGRHGPPG